MRKRFTSLLIAVLTLGIGGCATIPGHPVAQHPPALLTWPWDPCTELTPDVVRRMGVDPDTETPTATGRDDSRYCAWRESTSEQSNRLGVQSTTFSFRELEGLNTGTIEITVGDRPALQEKLTASDCKIILPVGARTVFVSAFDGVADSHPSDACTRALTAAKILTTVLPR
ncbi:DUF3558 family protein [Nocardia goodfellowii]|uniref:DUF3558 domain-containing protein n=1 Tax=Nocardia goodfellowii TaxID=882446 RepID=A0ABS4QLQ2_9NOCA|nr:DUF3558 family protein [Nocardia goodfellowii]MBP2192621.1 hypothetical protein [Nocardia goodfellowii]